MAGLSAAYCVAARVFTGALVQFALFPVVFRISRYGEGILAGLFKECFPEPYC
jgi:hypothetical protein